MLCPRVILSGLRGGSGKTVLTLGLIGALRRRGVTVAPFKKGPDYIDPQWLSEAAERPCRNLDAFLMQPAHILRSLALHGSDADIAVMEGNRGLFDGMDDAGTYSTAELAKGLQTPVLLAVDCTKTTRTAAAMVLGCKTLDPDLNIGGVILNQVARSRQEHVIRSAIESETGVPVLGALPRLADFSFTERHLGLYPPPEHPAPSEILDFLARHVETCVDIDAVLSLARSAPPLVGACASPGERAGPGPETVRIGVVRDEAFHFYYPENLEALEQRGARIVQINALADSALPALDALYIGGGFPESRARQLAENETMRSSIRDEIERGLPVLAECGGLVYLGRTLGVEGNEFPMVGVFPVAYTVGSRPQGHGYTVAKVDRQNPFFAMGTELRGHEFRYAVVQDCRHDIHSTVFRMQRGTGFDGNRDGLLYKNVLASFCHHHAVGNDAWADGLVRLATARKHGQCPSVASSDGTYG